MFAGQMGADSGRNSSISVLPLCPFTGSCQIESTIENKALTACQDTDTSDRSKMVIVASL